MTTKFWQAGTFTGFDSNDTSQAGAGDAITSRSRVKLKKHISSDRVLMATKLGRIVPYVDELLPIKSHDPLITWSCEIM